LQGGTLGFGPWAHGMALGPLRGPVMGALPSFILMTSLLGVTSDQPECL